MDVCMKFLSKKLILVGLITIGMQAQEPSGYVKGPLSSYYINQLLDELTYQPASVIKQQAKTFTAEEWKQIIDNINLLNLMRVKINLNTMPRFTQDKLLRSQATFVHNLEGLSILAQRAVGSSTVKKSVTTLIPQIEKFLTIPKLKQEDKEFFAQVVQMLEVLETAIQAKEERALVNFLQGKTSWEDVAGVVASFVALQKPEEEAQCTSFINGLFKKYPNNADRNSIFHDLIEFLKDNYRCTQTVIEAMIINRPYIFEGRSLQRLVTYIEQKIASHQDNFMLNVILKQLKDPDFIAQSQQQLATFTGLHAYNAYRR